MQDKPWERYDLTQEQWELMTDSDKQKLTGQQWTTQPCAVCGKPVSVLTNHEDLAWCLEHAGDWKGAQS